MVRELLSGRFANTAFCVFDPEGKQKLSRAGRSPQRSLASGENSELNNDAVVRQMARIASKYEAKGESDETLLQSFHSFRQALNVASSDQRLLVLVNAENTEAVTNELKPVFAGEEVVGKFHLHFTNKERDKNWSNVIKGDKNQPGIVIIRAGKFGLDGVVMKQLSASTNADELKAALLEANEKFADVEDRKNYSSHVAQGQRERIYFENEIPRTGINNSHRSSNQRGNQ